MIISGIYKITNIINGKCYIGCSKDIKKRWKQHTKDATKSQIHLAIQKYGVDNFIFEVLLECPNICFDYWEKYIIKKYNCVSPNGYNLTHGGKYNTTMTEETKQKLSKCNIGKVLSEEHKQKISKSNLGNKASEETKEKLSLSHLGILHTEETKQKMSKTRTGRKYSEEHKQKISLSLKNGRYKGEKKNVNY